MRRTGVWLADITEHRTAEGKLYLCAIKDVWSRRIAGYCIDTRMKSRLAVAALDNAAARRGDLAGCVLHTDRGSGYRTGFVQETGYPRAGESLWDGRTGAAFG